MRLTLREAAASLHCSESTVLRWIAHAGLPTTRLGGLYHFNRAELMEWAIHHGIGPAELSCELEPEDDADCSRVSALAAALRAGGVIHAAPGATLPHILRAAADHLLPEAPAEERDLIHAMLAARENEGVTAVGHGILAPHVRAPLILGETPRIVLAHLATPLAQEAVPTPDGVAVSAVFVLCSPTVRAHLTLLSLLATAITDADFRQAVLSRAPEQALQTAAAAAEQLHRPGGRKRGGRAA